MKLKGKIVSLTLASSIISLCLLQAYNIYRSFDLKDTSVAEFRNLLNQEYDKNIKNQVENAVSAIDGIYKLQLQGKMTLKEAETIAKETVRNIRYNKDGYFWIDTTDGINVMHPINPSLEGTNRISSKDIRGKLLIKEIIENGSKENGGFTDFYFPKPGETDPSPKRAYSLIFKPFNWVISTGNYIDHIEAVVNRQIEYYNNELIEKIIVSLFVFAAIIIATFIFTGLFSGRYIVNPISSLLNAFRNVTSGDGDLTRKIEISTKDELNELALEFNSFTDKIRIIIRDIKSVAENLAASASEMSMATMSFSENSQSQAESSKKVTESTNDITMGMNDVAEHTGMQFESLTRIKEKMDILTVDARELSQKVDESTMVITRMTENARTGMDSLKKMNVSMNEISGASKQMENIISIINDISDQINLLSLNAAIESARAGESGRGFAVVADEISKLAEETAGSIGEIASLIKKNDEEIKDGVRDLNEANSTIGEIISGVNAINMLEKQISEFMKTQLNHNNDLNSNVNAIQELARNVKNNTDQQKISMNDISSTIERIDRITQQSATGSEEMAATAEEISAMAEQLNHKVSFFKV